MSVRVKSTILALASPFLRRLWLPPLQVLPRIAVGIVTYNRPDYFGQVIGASLEHFSSIADLYVYNDGSQPNDSYRRIFDRLPDHVRIIDASENRGVAHAKNELLRVMKDHDYLFLLEDDIIPLSSRCITEYIRVSRKTGLEHLSFGRHGPANAGGPVAVSPWLDYYRNAIGAWCMYTRRALEVVGYMDENLHNAWEHIEHTHRIAKAGLTSPFWRFADVRGSHRWFREIPRALETSTIRNHPNWRHDLLRGLVYWSEKDPDGFPLWPALEDLQRKARNE